MLDIEIYIFASEKLFMNFIPKARGVLCPHGPFVLNPAQSPYCDPNIKGTASGRLGRGRTQDPLTPNIKGAASGQLRDSVRPAGTELPRKRWPRTKVPRRYLWVATGLSTLGPGGATDWTWPCERGLLEPAGQTTYSPSRKAPRCEAPAISDDSVAAACVFTTGRDGCIEVGLSLA